MKDEAFYNSDGEMLFVIQEGEMTFLTENGRLKIKPKEIAVMP
jgi:homogentisate 1,2-dioxygenase